MLFHRGRPRKPLPIHPNRVISSATRIGLSTTIQMQSDIRNRNTKDLFLSSKRAWSIARDAFVSTENQGAADLGSIMRAEPRIRHNMLLMLFEKAAEFGVIENIRVQSSDDEVGPLNQRLNAGGAALRGFSVTMFPFPDPRPFGYRTRGHGIAKKQFRVSGYEKSHYGPRTPLIHTDLPSLDFGDVIRSPEEFLSFFSTKQAVPVKDAARYVNLFLLRTRPFVEYIYSEHKCGLPAFRTGALAALRSIKEDIGRHYPLTFVEEMTVTDHLIGEPPRFSTDFFAHQVEEANLAGIDHPSVAELERILHGGYIPSGEAEQPCLTERDVEHIWKMVLKRARKEGSRVHRYFAGLFDSPWRLKDAILHGDEYNPTGKYLDVSEVVLETKLGAGRADHILLRREVLPDGLRLLYRPVMVLDYKTKTEYELDLSDDEIESESRALHGLGPRVVPVFVLRSRPMSNEEWKEVINSTPTPSALVQIEAYSRAINDEYCEISGLSQNRILTATLLLDPSKGVHFSREFYSTLFIRAYESMAAIQKRIPRTVFEPLVDGASVGVALVIHEQAAVNETENTAIEPPWHPAYDPLDGATEDGRRFILYLAGESPTSAGWSAAWIARYHHGLQMLYELANENDVKDMVWLDLADQFIDPGLAEARLSLRPYSYSEQDVLKCQPEHVRVFFEGIRKIGLWNQIHEHIFADGPVPEIGQIIKSVPNARRIIVVSGWDTIQDATPEPYRERLYRLLSYIIVQLPDNANTTILWFDSPVPGESSSIPYSTRTLLPFYQGSALMGEVNEIVWNLPVAPKSAIAPGEWGLPVIPGVPMYDDIRVIVTEHLDNFEMELTLIPQLIGWSRRFRSLGLGLVTPEDVAGVEESVPERETRDRMKALALSMVPWLVSLWPDTKLDDEAMIPAIKTVYEQAMGSQRAREGAVTISKRSIRAPPVQEPSLLERVRFRPRGSGHGRAFVPATIGRINSQRLYRKPNKIKTERRQQLRSAQVSPAVPTETLLYGQVFTNEDGSVQWIDMEDPQSPSRLLIGCFTNRTPDERGFEWSETDPGRLVESSSDEVLSLQCTNLTFRKVEGGLEMWAFEDGEQEPVFYGLKQIVSGGRRSVGMLRAIGGEPREAFSGGPPPPGPPVHFRKRVKNALKRWERNLKAVKTVTPVLKIDDLSCTVELLDEEGEGQVITVDSMADLVQILKYPLSSGSLRTDLGVNVTWNLFGGIEYGPLESIRGLVETSPSGTIAEPVAVRVRDLLKTAEGKLEIELSHSKLSCPLARGGADHGQCWHIRVVSGGSEDVKRRLERYMTAKEVYRALASSAVRSGGTCNLEVSFKPSLAKEESVVFRESGWLRRLLRDLGYKSAFAEVGTYARLGQQEWSVSVALQLDELTWVTYSTPTGLLGDNTVHSIGLDFSNNLKEESARILSTICRGTPRRKINEYDALENNLKHQLRSYGFGEKSPPCRIEVHARGSELEYVLTVTVLTLTAETRQLRVKHGRIEPDSQTTPESIIEDIKEMLDEGELSSWNVPDLSGLQEQVEGAFKDLGLPKETEGEEASMLEAEEATTCGEEMSGDIETVLPGEEEGPTAWVVEVFEEDCCIMWTATDSESPKKIGPEVWADDLKDLLAGTIAKKVREFQDLFKSDVEKRLGVVENRSDVLRTQIPEALREIREKCSKSKAAAGS